MAKRTPPAVRFWAKVNKDGPLPEHHPALGPCWLWMGRVFKSGYGSFWVNENNRRVHRFAYELLVGPIPDGLTIDHLCRRLLCVRPEHLDPVPTRTNTLRSPIALAAVNARKTHCPQGHPYSEMNTRTRRGKRYCRTCSREWGQRRRAKEAN